MKIKAFKMNPETTTTWDYLDFDGWDDFIIDGNDDYAPVHDNYSMYHTIKNHYYDLFSDISDFKDGYKANYKNITDIIETYLNIHPTTKQVHDIMAIWADYKDGHYRMFSDPDMIVDFLTVCEKRQWGYSTIRGCVQREYQTVFYPINAYSLEFIAEIESIYWNTGDEYRIVECADDEKCADYNDDEFWAMDGYFDYYPDTVTYDDDLLKKRIAEDVGVNPEDVTLYISSQHTITTWHAA